MPVLRALAEGLGAAKGRGSTLTFILVRSRSSSDDSGGARPFAARPSQKSIVIGAPRYHTILRIADPCGLRGDLERRLPHRSLGAGPRSGTSSTINANLVGKVGGAHPTQTQLPTQYRKSGSRAFAPVDGIPRIDGLISWHEGTQPIRQPTMIQFTCPCGESLQVEDWKAGRQTRCQECGRVETVPTFGATWSAPLHSKPTPKLRRSWGVGFLLLAGIVIGAIGIGLAKSVILAPQALHGSGSELNRKIYECYSSRSMRTGIDGVLYFEKPSQIVILSVERREKVNPRNEGIPYYVKVRVRFKDWTSRENDEWAFFVMDDKSVEYTPWGSLA